MPKTVQLATFGEILGFAESLGYGWNEAHSKLDYQSDFCILNDHGTMTWYEYEIDEALEEDSSLEGAQIMKAYLHQHQLDEITVTR